jgi:hypothetical protein
MFAESFVVPYAPQWAGGAKLIVAAVTAAMMAVIRRELKPRTSSLAGIAGRTSATSHRAPIACWAARGA